MGKRAKPDKPTRPKGGQNADELNDRQRRFVEAYMGKCAGNATRAYMEAYEETNADTAAAHASRLVRVGKVRARIDELIADDPLVASRHELQRRLTAIALGEDRGETYYNESGQRVDRWGSKVADEIRAAEVLMKSRGDMIEKVEHSGPGGKPIKVQNMTAMGDAELIAFVGSLHATSNDGADE